MHGLLLSLFLWGPIADVSGQAGATLPPTITETAPSPRDVQRSVPPSPIESARLRWMQEQLFARDALYLDHRANVVQGGGAIDEAVAYLIIGRPDLANQVRERRSMKGITRVVGVAALTVGLVWGVLDVMMTGLGNALDRPLTCGSMSFDPKCADKSHPSILPWVVAVGGGAAWLTSAGVPEDPLTGAEKARLIADYNWRLRAGLGLSSALDTARRTANLHAAVGPDGHAGMLVAGGSF